MEFFQGAPQLDTLYVPIGMGSGICGVLAAREALGLRTEVVGVIAREANTYALSMREGVPVGAPPRQPIRSLTDWRFEKRIRMRSRCPVHHFTLCDAPCRGRRRRDSLGDPSLLH